MSQIPGLKSIYEMEKDFFFCVCKQEMKIKMVLIVIKRMKSHLDLESWLAGLI